MTRLKWWDGIGLLALAGYMLAGTSLTPFHGDESTLVFMSRDYAYQFIQRDLSRVRYSDPPHSAQEQNLRLLNGTVSKYLIGLAWHVGGFAIEDTNEQWDWGADWDYNVQAGHAPDEALLQTARWSSSLFMAAGVFVLFALGWLLGGRPVAYGASLYYALNPALLLNGHRAMMESQFMFFSLALLLAGIVFLRRGSWWLALLLGVCSGLALASKHSAAFMIAAVFAGCGIYISVQFVRTQHVVPLLRKIGYLVAASMIVLLVFYGLNPAWWGDPLNRAGTVLTLRENLLAIQVDVFGGYEDWLDRVAGFARQALIVRPQYYEVDGWGAYIGDQIAPYEASVWRGVSIGGSSLGAALLTVMMGSGAWHLIRNRRSHAATHWLIGLWALAVLALTLGLTPVEWQRYYVPAYPVIGLLAALGMVESIRRLKDILT